MLDGDVEMIQNIMSDWKYSKPVRYGAWQRIKTALEEAQKQSTPSTNTSMPKLPEFNSVYLLTRDKIGVVLNQGTYLAMKTMYDIIAGKIGS